jgi:hypothetical protein
MLTGPKEGLSEEAYYMAEFTPEEIAQVGQIMCPL